MKESWETRKLGEICKTGAGGTPLKSNKDYYEGGKIPWILSGEVSQGEITKTYNFITEKGLKNSSAKIFPKNTVLVAMYGATAGQVGILRFEACTNQAVCGILPNEKTIPEFLFYYFLLKKDDLVSQAIGGAQPNISQEKIRNIKIPLLSLHEQRRIVSILDQAFAAIDKAKANAELNLKNSRELFECQLQNIFSIKHNGWEEKELGEVCCFVGGSQPSKNHFEYKYREGLIRLVQIRDYKSDNHIVYIPIEKAKRFCNENDIMIGRYGPPLFQILKGLNGAYNVALMKAVPDEKIINRAYLYYYLQHNSIQKYIINLSDRAVGQTGISKDDLEIYPIYFPDLDEQSSIANKLTILQNEINRLEAIYEQKLLCLDELKKNILKKAFSGELTIEKSISI